MLFAMALLAGCIGQVGSIDTASPEIEAAATATRTQIPVPSATLSRSPPPTQTLSDSDRFLLKPSGDSIRLMTYNVGWDSIFPSDDPQNHDLRTASRVRSFARIMRAIQPDIVCLQEINERRSRSELAEYLGERIDPTHTDDWKVAHVRDTVIATRFDLVERGYQLETRTVLPNLDQAAALIDLPDEVFGRQDLYVICAHFKAGGGLGDILLRVRQADAIMAHLRDFRDSDGVTRLTEGTPYVILGDFNIYETDPARQLRTLVHGDIEDQERYGPDWAPDWDGSPLTDAQPSHNGLGQDYYTWREDASPFNPRALDRIIYSDSVLGSLNSFVLNTRLMTGEILAGHGLQRDDVLMDPASGVFDHLPVVIDMSFGTGK